MRDIKAAMSISRRLVGGIRRNPWRFFISVAVAVAALWAPLEPVTATFTSLTKWPLLAILLGTALVIAAARSMLPAAVTIKWPATRVEIVVGDLFSAAKHVVVSADNFFLVAHPKLVNPRSLIAQAAQRKFRASTSVLENRLRQALAKLDQRGEAGASAAGNGYPIGTTVVLREQGANIFVTSVCRINLTSETGSATAEDVLIALNAVWRAIADNPTGEPVAVPLIGGGQSGCGLSAAALLHLQLVSLAAFVRDRTISDAIMIVLPAVAAQEVDLSAVRDAWNGTM